MNRSSISSEILFHELPSKGKRPSIRKQVALSLSSKLIVLVFTKQPSAERYLARFFCQYFCELLENSSSALKYVPKSFRTFTKNHPCRSLMLVKLHRSSDRMRSVKRCSQKRCSQNSQEKACFRDSISIKLHSQGCKKRLWHKCFPNCEFSKISKNTFFTEHLWTTASVFSFSEAATGGVL